VFHNPATDRLEHAGSYLTGAVRQKLQEAVRAAEKDPAFAVNVAALEAVQPRLRQLGEFTVQLGASWVPPELVQGFLRDYLGDLTLRVEHTPLYGWSIYAGKVPEERNLMLGTPRVPALRIAQKVLGNSDLTVYDTEVTENGKVTRAANDADTRAVRQKADAMRSAFEAYVTGTRERATVLVEAFNEVMNGHVVRNYDGLSPTLDGLTTERTPHAHQLAAAARMQYERSVILAHEVGLGKTTTMVLGAMALKASQQVTKPVVVVPNHLAQQWYDEASFLYPNADILLITSEDLAEDRRRATLEYLRSNTPDLVIFTEPAFTSVRMSPEHQERYIFGEVERLKEQIKREKAEAGVRLQQSRLQERLERFEAEIRTADAPMRRPGEVYWDDLGFDYLLIDEAHRFKGLGIKSRLAYSQSKIKALDLHQKLDHLHQLRPDKPVVTLATGTPLTNSISEMHTLLRYAAPWILRQYGCEGFDEWAALFGKTKVRLEMAPDGSGVRLVERFSEFTNLTALSTQWRLITDVKTADEVGIKRPTIA
ncbi:SNF2-related protein, partial [Kitasatospora sp. NPDC093558]|uniref:SNF2-related protein n=1 Tax=Kitasatospora sp. NPDC093558 TaxID=3155201 RepID=UPI003417AE98